MTIWNVCMPAIALVEAEDEQEAENIMRRAIEAAGLTEHFDPGAGYEPSVFESEPEYL